VKVFFVPNVVGITLQLIHLDDGFEYKGRAERNKVVSVFGKTVLLVIVADRIPAFNEANNHRMFGIWCSFTFQPHLLKFPLMTISDSG
jgi:hypothetical protein